MRAQHELTAAIAIGLLLAMRPTLLFWPAFLYLAGHRRIALRSMAIAGIASAYPTLLYGNGVYREWAHALANDAHGAISANIAIISFFSRIGLLPLGAALAAAAAIASAWICLNRKPDANMSSAIALGAWLLCSPLSWVHYTLVAGPWFVADRWNRPANMAAALLAVPMIIPVRLSAGSTLHRIYFVPACLIFLTFLDRLACQNRAASTMVAKTLSS